MTSLVRRLTLLLGSAVLLAVASLVYLDAASHAYRRGDGTARQPPGAFVTLERWIGATRPTTWARPAEYVAVAVLTVGAVLILGKALKPRG